MNWIASEASVNDLLEDARSSVFAVGNGRLCTRGTAADAFRAGRPPYPFRGTYVAGLYTRAGWGLEHPFCAPDWLAAAVGWAANPRLSAPSAAS
jgi:trehalose/maltose hydrolase-like predicted phosphorylase